MQFACMEMNRLSTHTQKQTRSRVTTNEFVHAKRQMRPFPLVIPIIAISTRRNLTFGGDVNQSSLMD